MAPNKKKQAAEQAKARSRHARRRDRARLISDLGIDRGADVKFIMDYHVADFHRLFHELAVAQAVPAGFSSARWRFWQSVPTGQYSSSDGAALVQQYVAAIEDEMRRIVSAKSVAYWLHLFRRLAPGPIGEDTRPGTIQYTRAVVEAAVQKWGKFAYCGHIAKSTDVPMSAILQGRLEKDNDKHLIAHLQEQPQLVLTDFGQAELLEVIELEKLAYECWKAMAKLRGLGKGAGLVVTGRANNPMDEHRDRHLALLIRSYDERTMHSPFCATATGTVFGTEGTSDEPKLFLPRYNIDHVLFKDLTNVFNAITGDDVQAMPTAFQGPNFVWTLFDIRGYFAAHRPFSDGFRELNNVSLEAVVALLATLCLVESSAWRKNSGRMWRAWQRAYDGPLDLPKYKPDLLSVVPKACKKLELPFVPDASSLEQAIEFLTLKEDQRDGIGIAYPGPHYVFLPCGGDRVFIDYANISSRLYYLFHGVQVSDQNFKGDALELLARRGQSVLPTGKLKATDGTSRQIDVSVAKDDLLVIGECRANSWSIAMERGDPKAVEIRRKIVDKALDDIDEKARWLAAHPVGTNYDIQKFQTILPIGITPFREFIPSTDRRYWVTTRTPRVLTPDELEDLLSDRAALSVGRGCKNAVSVAGK